MHGAYNTIASLVNLFPHPEEPYVLAELHYIVDTWLLCLQLHLLIYLEGIHTHKGALWQEKQASSQQRQEVHSPAGAGDMSARSQNMACNEGNGTHGDATKWCKPHDRKLNCLAERGGPVSKSQRHLWSTHSQLYATLLTRGRVRGERCSKVAYPDQLCMYSAAPQHKLRQF